MSSKLFITGATGYIGGDFLYTFVQKFPELESHITCLVRNPERGAMIAAAYPSITLVYGDLEEKHIIEAEASKADIVLDFANSADSVPAAQAITTGLSKRSSDKPGYWIHTSGTGILTWSDLDEKKFGETSAKVYDDLDGIKELMSLPDHANHRNVDKIVLQAGTTNTSGRSPIMTAIVCPPTIYGVGRGPGNKRSIQLPILIESTIKTDLSNMYVSLVEIALADDENATWGADGYYFAENGEHVWGEIAVLVAREAQKQGLIETDQVSSSPGKKVVWVAAESEEP